MAALDYHSLGKLNFYIHDLLDMMMYEESNRCYEFKFGFSRTSRQFLEHNYPYIGRSYDNEGLAIKHIKMMNSTDIYEALIYLEKICTQTALRRKDN